jgi:hypothetical protein
MLSTSCTKHNDENFSSPDISAFQCDSLAWTFSWKEAIWTTHRHEKVMLKKVWENFLHLF